MRPVLLVGISCPSIVTDLRFTNLYQLFWTDQLVLENEGKFCNTNYKLVGITVFRVVGHPPQAVPPTQRWLS